MTLASADSFPLKFLRVSATVLVAATFFVAGLQKLIHPDAGVTMLARYIATPRSVSAFGCGEMAIALWLGSFRFPRAAVGLAAIALIGFSILIGLELRRTQPLPCGCMPLMPGASDPHAVRRGLWVALARNGFVIVVAVTAASLAPRGNEQTP